MPSLPPSCSLGERQFGLVGGSTGVKQTVQPQQDRQDVFTVESGDMFVGEAGDIARYSYASSKYAEGKKDSLGAYPPPFPNTSIVYGSMYSEPGDHVRGVDDENEKAGESKSSDKFFPFSLLQLS